MVIQESGIEMNQFNPQGKNRQILDWFHLVENLHKVGGSLKVNNCYGKGK